MMSTRVTYSTGIEASAVSCTDSLVQSSTTVSVFTLRPVASSSNTNAAAGGNDTAI